MNGYEIRVLKPNGDTALISAPIQRADSAAIRVRQEACWRLQVRGLERAGCIYRSVKKLPADRRARTSHPQVKVRGGKPCAVRPKGRLFGHTHIVRLKPWDIC